MYRRNFIKSALIAPAFISIPSPFLKAKNPEKAYFYLGRTEDYLDYKIIEPGRVIQKIESFTKNAISIVRITTKDGLTGYGQISTYDADISATILHRKIVGQFLGKDPANIDQLVDLSIEANYKFPWSYICRALCGVETAVWDLYGKIKQKPVVELLGGKARPYLVYGSSMRRDIKPVDEANRLKKLKEEQGYKAFKVRLGKVNGHNGDTWPGRTEELISIIRKTLGNDIDLLADANSCYTPDKAIEIGKLMEDFAYYQFEEPCPYWELEWTKQVTDQLKMYVSGGEQDNDLAQWRRMIMMGAVDIVQPDICYLGGITRTLRVAKMAEKKDIKIVPHSANLSLVTIFAVHLLGALPNSAPYLEYTIEHNDGVNQQAKALYSPQLEVKNGAVQIPADPGWGVKIADGWLKSANYQKSEA